MKTNQELTIGIGDYCESISAVLLQQWTAKGVLFRIVNIGGNYPTIDVYAEVQNKGNTYIALFQIKSTEKPITKKGALQIQIPKKKLNALSNICVPTYLIGVQYNKENPPESKGFIKGIYGSYKKGLGSLNTKYSLDSENLINLKDEIVNFWIKSNVVNLNKNYNSIFV